MGTHIDVVLVDWGAGMERRVATLSLSDGHVVVTGSRSMDEAETIAKAVAGASSLEVAAARVASATAFRVTGRHRRQDCAFAAGDDRPMAAALSLSELRKLRSGSKVGQALDEARHLRVAQ